MTNLKHNGVRCFYSAILLLTTPFYLLKLWLRGRKEPEYRQRIGERFGFYKNTQARYRGEYVWVHAVSLGETRACAILLDELRQLMPDMKLLLTHGTATGWEQGTSLLQEGDAHCWVPVDQYGAVQRFLHHFQPRIGLLLETEVWPNLLRSAEHFGVPVILTNARLSERSLRNAGKAGALLRDAYTSLTAALAQTEEDAYRLRQIGVQKVEVLGNIKYDMRPAPELMLRGEKMKQVCQRPVVMAASTREGEEELLLHAWRQMDWTYLQPREERPVLLIVPRHPQRFEEVGHLITSLKLKGSVRSSWQGDILDNLALDADVWLGDSLQEMAMYYALSDMVLLGGSFKSFGGQNLIEALSCGCPVILGEYTYNFKQASEAAIEAGVAIRVNDFDQGLKQANTWLSEKEQLDLLQAKSRAFIAAHQGAARKMADYIVRQLQKKA